MSTADCLKAQCALLRIKLFYPGLKSKLFHEQSKLDPELGAKLAIDVVDVPIVAHPKVELFPSYENNQFHNQSCYGFQISSHEPIEVFKC